MLRPSRDWRESMTLSSRDPHFGQRIVSEHSLSHNRLWRQCIRIAFFHVPFSLERTALSPCKRLGGASQPGVQHDALQKGRITLRQLSAPRFSFSTSASSLRTRSRFFHSPVSDKRRRDVPFLK